MIFFFNDTATTEIYTLSLHDALPILLDTQPSLELADQGPRPLLPDRQALRGRLAVDLTLDREQLVDRKSTRLNSSHANISYAVFCLKKQKNQLISNFAKVQHDTCPQI